MKASVLRPDRGGRRANRWSCSQIVVKVKLDGRPELIAIHTESYDGIVHEHGVRETNGLAS